MRTNFFLAAILLATSFFVVGFVASDDLIQWQAHRPLKWADFKASVPKNTQHAALTNSGISLDLSGTNNSLSISVVAQFDKQKSWSKRESESDFLLKHEQLHFDITELFARKLRKKIMYGKWKGPEQINMGIQPMYDENKIAWKAYQAAYDLATNHSIDRAAQEVWNVMVKDSLAAYDKFKGQTIKLDF